MKACLLIVGLHSWANGFLFKKSIPTYMCWRALRVISSNSFCVSVFILRSLTHLELVCVQANEYGSNLIFLHVNIQFLQHLLLKILSFLQYIFLLSMSNIKCLQLPVLIFVFSILLHWFTCLFSTSTMQCFKIHLKSELVILPTLFL